MQLSFYELTRKYYLNITMKKSLINNDCEWYFIDGNWIYDVNKNLEKYI